MKVAAVQLALRFYDGPEDFLLTIAQWTGDAARAGADLVVFPEDVGLPLVCVDDYRLAETSKSLEQAITRMAARYWRVSVASLLRRGRNIPAGLFLHKGAAIRDLYFAAFSQAAREHKVHVVAGSAILPGQRPHGGRIYNTSYVFDPTGEMLGMARKVEGIELERGVLGLSFGNRGDLPVFEANGVSLGVVICLDAWNADTVGRLARRGAKIIASPQANPTAWSEEEKVENRRGLFSRCQEYGVFGIQAMAVGHLAGVVFEGQSAIFGPVEASPDRSGVLAEASDATREQLVIAELEL